MKTLDASGGNVSSSFGTVTDVGKVLTPDISLDIGHTHTRAHKELDCSLGIT